MSFKDMNRIPLTAAYKSNQIYPVFGTVFVYCAGKNLRKDSNRAGSNTKNTPDRISVIISLRRNVSITASAYMIINQGR